MTQEELDGLQEKAISQFKKGESLFGKGGAFAPLLKQFLEAALEAEMDEHLDEKERIGGNRRNGKKSKQLKSSYGSIELDVPQDRHSNFSPEIVKKRETILADNLEDKIIGLYGLGMSLRDISAHIKEMYDTDISHTVLSEITDRVLPEVKSWQNRTLESVYCIVWLDAMHYKVRIEGKVEHRALYYQADTKDLAEVAFLELSEKWRKKYPVVIQSWERNWEKLTTYFQYTQPIRKLIYTTNTVEGYHRQIRKVTKTKGAFPSDDALIKLVYLATRNIEKKWTSSLQNWGLTVQQLAIKFEGRLILKLAQNA